MLPNHTNLPGFELEIIQTQVPPNIHIYPI